MLKLNILFQNHMVLQRDKQITVWGTTKISRGVTVTMQGKVADTVADTDGKWKIICGPFETSFAEEMVITSGEERLVLQDVQVGEVWLAGGQSNMEYHMCYDADMDTEREICTNDNIRFFDYPEVSYVGQIDEADYRKNYGFWRKAEPDQLERFSAVGYYFAKDIQNKYHVPIGIIGCNWGGTPACAWMSPDAVIEGGGQIYLDDYEEAVKGLDLVDYEERFRNCPGSWRVDQLDEQTGDALGIVGPKAAQRPSGLYESMLKPMVPYSIRGIIWYQGETDGDHHPEVYKTLFPALIRDWRKLWNEELPFLFVQIAPLDRWMDCFGECYIEIRTAQQYTVDTVSGTGMAVITDVGMQYDIHPMKKQPVGHRLALLAENKVYGEDVLCEAPTLSEVSVEEGKLVLTFENAGEGLYLAETMPYGQVVGAGKLGGLQIFQNGKALDADLLHAKAEGNRVVIIGADICPGVTTQVKLAETGWYLVNLYNSAEIPARPANVLVEF